MSWPCAGLCGEQRAGPGTGPGRLKLAALLPPQLCLSFRVCRELHLLQEALCLLSLGLHPTPSVALGDSDWQYSFPFLGKEAWWLVVELLSRQNGCLRVGPVPRRGWVCMPVALVSYGGQILGGTDFGYTDSGGWGRALNPGGCWQSFVFLGSVHSPCVSRPGLGGGRRGSWAAQLLSGGHGQAPAFTQAGALSSGPRLCKPAPALLSSLKFVEVGCFWQALAARASWCPISWYIPMGIGHWQGQGWGRGLGPQEPVCLD